MKNKEQKYATRVFNKLQSAEGFKMCLGNRCLQTIKQDKLGRYKVRWLINKEKPIVIRNYDYEPNFEEHWKF